MEQELTKKQKVGKIFSIIYSVVVFIATIVLLALNISLWVDVLNAENSLVKIVIIALIIYGGIALGVALVWLLIHLAIFRRAKLPLIAFISLIISYALTFVGFLF